MNIPDEAVEAAYRAINYPEQQAIDRDEIRIILEAAAPHVLAPVFSLHHPAPWKPGNPRPAGSDTVCGWCGTTYPCATIEAITGVPA